MNYHFFFSNQYQVYLTKNCKDDNCEVKKILSSLSLGEIFNYKGDFINPGSQICEGKGGQIVRGKTKNKSEISFCLFKDNSLISLNSLAKVALKKNKEESE